MNAMPKKEHFCSLLHEAYPLDTAKHAARAADAPVTTAKRWVRGVAEPRGSVWLRMAERCDRWAAVLERVLDDRRRARLARGQAAPSRGIPAAPGSTSTPLTE